jgi:hypothetical protein
MPIPNPEPGLVISYAYLWHHEHEAGSRTGRGTKRQAERDRACHRARRRRRHRRHRLADNAQRARPSVVEIPMPVNGISGSTTIRPGSSSARAMNLFGPGQDLRKRPRSDRYDYGFSAAPLLQSGA